MSTGFKSSPEATLLLSILDVARDLAAGTETVSETKRALHRLGNPLPTPSEAEDLLRRAEQKIQEILDDPTLQESWPFPDFIEKVNAALDRLEAAEKAGREARESRLRGSLRTGW